jgi:hypothetical protein
MSEKELEVPIKETQPGMLGSQINQASNVPSEHKNDPAVNLGNELTAQPGNLGGGAINYQKDHDMVQRVLAQAKEEYKFIPKDMMAVANRKDVEKHGHLESFAAGESGTPEYPRPESLSLYKHGLEVYNIDGIQPKDIAGDKMHTDGIANDTRHILNKSLSGSQLDTLYKTANDYQFSINKGQDHVSARRNAVDSAMRGYVVGQWDKESNDAMQYTPDQIELLDNLKHYVKNGVEK